MRRPFGCDIFEEARDLGGCRRERALFSIVLVCCPEDTSFVNKHTASVCCPRFIGGLGGILTHKFSAKSGSPLQNKSWVASMSPAAAYGPPYRAIGSIQISPSFRTRFESGGMQQLTGVAMACNFSRGRGGAPSGAVLKTSTFSSMNSRRLTLLEPALGSMVRANGNSFTRLCIVCVRSGDGAGSRIS